MKSLTEFAQRIPKAELHLHIEGTLEPELMLKLARQHGIALPYTSVAEVREAYQFQNLQSFLDIYYQGASVLQTESDFHELMVAYLERAQKQGVRHAEIFFDPQTHTSRGIAYDVVLNGLVSGLQHAQRAWDISGGLILCFLRHLSAEDAMKTLEQALPRKEHLLAVGLDSSEVGHPPEKFMDVFARARAQGLRCVAHAGEEGPPEYIWQALDVLHAQRIDHGVRCLEDDALVERLRSARIPLTVCPFSNVKLRVFSNLEAHNLKRLMDAGLMVTINSDDPSYFGGYVGDNIAATATALSLTRDDIAKLSRTSFEASFASAARKQALSAELDAFLSH